MGFILAYTAAFGVVFFSTVAFHLRKPVSVMETIYSGARLGTRWLTQFVFLRWAPRDAMVQFLCIWFFADVRDQNDFSSSSSRCKDGELIGQQFRAIDLEDYLNGLR
ncbi:hypothetical protein OPV22_028975 [Ensete ventricosum]|uniref:Uncharacterized protein n=1 Tax=Ensete ventricosum TaxID=4639 RepID=A0AAV8Q7X5_ENSVE|nr:hypothetical protein OPV22_028975 [Ensete ventricosum]